MLISHKGLWRYEWTGGRNLPRRCLPVRGTALKPSPQSPQRGLEELGKKAKSDQNRCFVATLTTAKRAVGSCRLVLFLPPEIGTG